MSPASRLRLSLVSNGLLALLVGALLAHRPRSPAAPATDIAATSAGARVRPLAAETSRRAAAPGEENPSASRRRRAIIDELRALGVPNEVLARIALVDYEAHWDARFEACKGDMAKSAAVQLAMDKGKDAEMKAALGEEGFRQWDQGYMLWEAMNTRVDVSPEEADALYALKKTLQRRNLELDEARLTGSLDEAGINEAQDRAYGEYYQQLHALLGDERYAKSQQLDDAFLADNLRHQLAAAAPNEAQIRSILQWEKGWNRAVQELDHQFRDNPADPGYQTRLAALNQARDQYQRGVLGEEAFATVQKERDPAYGQMKKYGKLWGLDDAKIDYVHDAMRAYSESVELYKTEVLTRQAEGRDVDWETVNRNLGQFADQTRQTLEQHLGAESFGKLQNNRVLRFVQVQRRAN